MGRVVMDRKHLQVEQLLNLPGSSADGAPVAEWLNGMDGVKMR